VEAERTFVRGPLTTLRGSAAVYRRINPHFDLADTRREVSVLADRLLTPWLRVGADARVAGVSFGLADGRLAAAGGHVVLDTRQDPSFPRNAVHATLAWERMTSGQRTAGAWNTDLRGYLGIGGSAVLAMRAQSSGADAALPPSEQRLLGGSETLRGYRAGHRAGDRLAAVSIEIRQPLTSPLNYGRVGVKAFIDAGTTWDAGERLRRQHWDRGIGGGVYVGATAVTANIDVAWPRDGKPRVHLGLGVTF
jgi:outer membrane protein assembly factor BamA